MDKEIKSAEQILNKHAGTPPEGKRYAQHFFDAMEEYASQFQTAVSGEPLYRSVKVSERLPKIDGFYFVQSEEHHGIKAKGISWFKKGKFDENLADEWLEEVKPTSVEEKEIENKPKVVCFCGSTRFANTFMIERWKLEKQGIITLGINILPNGYFTENHHGAEQEGVKHILDELHKRKIDLSDEVFILNVDGYIGESTRAELEYAESIGKPIKYLESYTPKEEQLKQ